MRSRITAGRAAIVRPFSRVALPARRFRKRNGRAITVLNARSWQHPILSLDGGDDSRLDARARASKYIY